MNQSIRVLPSYFHGFVRDDGEWRSGGVGERGMGSKGSKLMSIWRCIFLLFGKSRQCFPPLSHSPPPPLCPNKQYYLFISLEGDKGDKENSKLNTLSSLPPHSLKAKDMCLNMSDR